MALNSVTVNISIADTALAQTNFATMLIFAEFDGATSVDLQTGSYFTDNGESTGDELRYKLYTSLEAVGEDFITTSAIYKMAEDAFAQENVLSVAVGRKDPSSDATIGDALNAIMAENNGFYGIVSTFNTSTDIEAIAAWTQTQTKAYFAKSNDADILTADTDCLASTLKDASYDRTVLFYHADLTDHIDAAACALMLTFRAGSTTLEDKNLKSIATDNLTPTQRGYVDAKKCNFYVSDRGQGVVKGGYTCQGRFFDTRFYADYVKSAMETNIRLLQIRKSNIGSKISFTDDGIGEIANVVDTTLGLELAQGYLTPLVRYANGRRISIPYIVSALPAALVPQNEKANREYKYIGFEADYASAIHSATISGVITA